MKPIVIDNLIVDKFWGKVNKLSKDDCWIWKGISYKKDDYGIMNGILAHRLSWKIHFGEIPKGKLILHKCDNKKCVNPNHLYVGTHKDNRRDRGKRNPTPSEVSGIGRAKLHEGEIWLIRKLKVLISSPGVRKRYKFPAKFVSKIFKVHETVIHDIWNSDKHLCKEGYYI